MGFTEQHNLVGKPACRRMLAYHFSYTSFKIDKTKQFALDIHLSYWSFVCSLIFFSHPIKEELQ